MNPNEFLDEEEPKPPKLKRDRVDFARSFEHRRLGYCTKDRFVDNYNIQAIAEDTLVKKEFSDTMCELPGAPRSTFLMVFSPDGTKVASTHGNHNIYITDIKTGRNIKMLVGHPRTPWCIAFHPTSNQIVASGCLGGQVRIWDLSGGSEVWTVESQTVIASIAFHPDDRVLVIATYNNLYFWDWSKPEPFMHISTASVKEKVRYVAFDKLGQKLITGISNDSLQSRWVRPQVSVPRQNMDPNRFSTPFNRRIITPRIISVPPQPPPSNLHQQNEQRESIPSSSNSSVPERERRITACYRNLLREYEQLVHRYLQICRPPTMVDQGTDPMEMEDVNSPSTSSTQRSASQSVGEQSSSRPSTSGISTLRSTAASVSRPSTSSSRITYTPRPVAISRYLTVHPPQIDIEPSQPVPPPPPPVNPQEFYTDFIFSPPRTNVDSSTSRCLPVMRRRPSTLIQGTQTSNTSNPTENPHPHMPGCPARAYADARRNIFPEFSSNVSPLPFFTPLGNRSNFSRRDPNSRSKRGEKRGPPKDKTDCNNEKPSSSGIPMKRSNSSNNASTDRSVEEQQNQNNLGMSRIQIQRSSSKNNDESIPSTSNHHDANTLNSEFHDIIWDLREKMSRIVSRTRGNGGSSSSNRRGSVNNPQASTSNAETLIRPNYLSSLRQVSNTFGSAEGQSNAASLNQSTSTATSSVNANDQSEHVDIESDIPATTIDARGNTSSIIPPIVTADTVGPSTANSDSNLRNAESSGKMRKLVKKSKFNVRWVFPPSTVSNTVDSHQRPTSSNHININLEENVAENGLTRNTSESSNSRDDEPSSSSNSNNYRFPPFVADSCARTNLPCSSARSNFRTTSNYSSAHPRRRFFSHRSAFCPPRVNSSRLHPRYRRHTNNSPTINSRSRYQSSERNNPLFALDEVINYSERVNTEDETNTGQQQSTTNTFHPFDPPPDFLSIHPQNIGIGNMYSNIVQELESSLNDVRNIRASNRLGETSDMLSSFSERLQSIVNQSHAILRNLGTTIENITSGVEANTSQSPITTPTELERTPQLSFNDRNFYVRENRSESAAEGDNLDHTDAVAADHTYPMNPRSSQSGTNSITPLMASLYLTVSHIQRQARLLRQQVESIERIDSAMLEVAQLQVVRHILTELQSHFQLPNQPSTTRNNSSGEGSNTQSTLESEDFLRQPEPSLPNNTSTSNNEEADYLNNPEATANQPSRGNTNRPYARCIFLMRTRRNPVSNIIRRQNPRERLIRRHIFRRTTVTRTRIPRNSTEPQDNEEPRLSILANLQMEALPNLTRRLEHFLMEHARLMGVSIQPDNHNPNTTTDVGEYLLTLRLNNCRLRVSRLLGTEDTTNSMPDFRSTENSTVTSDGRGRYAARQTLVSVIDTLLRFVEANRGGVISSNHRSNLLEVIELSLLLSEILLLQIVDSIPPPTGMNLDPERESLSNRINQMCSNMLQSRLSGQSQQLTRSLRLMRMTVRHATHALDQTYNARRNAILPMGADRNRRRELLQEIHDCLRNIRRRGGLLTAISLNRISLPVRERLRLANLDLSAIRELSSLQDPPSAEGRSREGTSSEPGPSTSDSSSSRLYRTNNVNLLSCDRVPESGPRLRSWDVPLVQVNDVPVSESAYAYPWPSRYYSSRQRLIERFQELRTSQNTSGLLRPRFLHPLYTGNANNPFDSDIEDQSRDQIFEGDIVTTVAPNHRIQLWKFSPNTIPDISNPVKNVVVSECKIHNDASVDIASDGTMLVTLLPSGGYLNITNRLGVYSLNWETLGQCLYITSLEHNAVSVSLSPLNRHLVVGLATRRISIIPNDKWTMARIFTLDSRAEVPNGRLSAIRQLEQNREATYISVNCIRWLPVSGQGLVYATNSGQLRVLS